MRVIKLKMGVVANVVLNIVQVAMSSFSTTSLWWMDVALAEPEAAIKYWRHRHRGSAVPV